MLNKIKNKIKKLVPSKGIDYQVLYENERRLRIELERTHKALCGQIGATLRESKERYSVYKATSSDKEF